jgi:broad specificity phosphatase PhoE
VTTFLLARHGETDWNREHRFQGRADPPLNALGRRQARELADALAGDPIDAIYTSPLSRARETADIVGRRLGMPVQPIDGLMEIDVGSWSGLTRNEVADRFPAAFRRWIGHGPGWEDGETYEQAGRRVVGALLDVAARHPGQRVLVVTHGGPIRAVQAHAAGVSHGEATRLSGPLRNCELAAFAVEDGELAHLD